MNTVLSSLFKGSKKPTTTLMELNTTQYKRLKDNCIILSGLRIDSSSNHIYYDNIKMGKKISVTKETKNLEVQRRMFG